MALLLNFILKTSIVLLVFLAPLTWTPFALEPFEPSKQYVLLFFVTIGIVAWLAKMILVERELRFQRTSLNIPVLLFALAAVLSAAFSADIWSSLFGSYGRFSDGLLGLLSVVGLYFLIINNVEASGAVKSQGQNTNSKQVILAFLLSAGIAVFISYLSLFGVLPYATGFNTVASSPEGFALFLAFLVSFLSALVIRSDIKQGPWIGMFALLLSCLGLLFFLNVPKAWAILVFGLVLVLLSGLFSRALLRQTIRLRRLWFLATLLLFAVGALFSPSQRIATQEPVLSQHTSWSIAFNTITDSAKNLVLGSGPGTFALDFSKHRPAELNGTPLWQIRFDRAGNHISELLSTMGILGFLSYLGFFVLFFFISLVFLKDTKTYPFALGALVLFAIQLVSWQTTLVQFSFWLFASLSVISWELPVSKRPASLVKRGERGSPNSIGRPKKELRFSLRKFVEFDGAAKALLLVVLLAGGALLFFATRFFQAEVRYAAVNKQNSSVSAKIEATLQALALNPWQAEYRMVLSRLYLARVGDELRKSESSRNKEQLSRDIQYAIAYARGDRIGEQRVVGAVELSPNRVAAWETLGGAYREITFAAGALEWGIRSYENAIALEPANPVLYTELGKLEARKKEFEKAKERFERALALKPDYREAELQLALIKEKEGDAPGAISSLRAMSLRSPLNTNESFELGRLLYNRGEVQEAIFQFEQILKTVPNQSNALFALGVALQSQGRIEEAKARFERVVQLNPGNKEVQEKLQELGQ